MEPYHNIMRLPGEARGQEEFVLMLPFTPQGKHVLRAWMCARNDGDQYGKLLVYNFPKGEQIDGPYQIEARISQNEQIREQLALWQQGGNVVIRGNLLVVPIEKSLLYVEPLFLQAAQGEIPELKRVIVAYGDQIVMQRNLQECLEILFGHTSTSVLSVASTVPLKERQPVATTSTEPADLASRAVQHWEQAKASLRNDDWVEFGHQMQSLETILENLKENANTSTSDP